MSDQVDDRDSAREWVQRLEALEVKACYADDLLEVLNATVIRQQLEIDQLRLALLTWRAAGAGEQTGESRSLRDELPPHY